MARYILLFFLAVIFLYGCAKENESVVNKAGEKVGEVISDFTAGVGKGIDKKMLIDVELSDKLKEKGIELTVSKQDSLFKKTIVLYLAASGKFTGKVIAKAYNNQGHEIGRSIIDLKLAKDEAKYVTFEFHKEMDIQLVENYLVDML